MNIAPDFTLKNSQGQETQLYTQLENGHVVLFFYPKNNTVICTKEACLFRDKLTDFSSLNAAVFGISNDNEASHLQFQEKHNIQYELLSDENNTVRALYGVKKHLLFIPGRETIVIHQNKSIIGRFRSNNQAAAHIEFALKTLRLLEQS